jgi:hypothetical protein
MEKSNRPDHGRRKKRDEESSEFGVGSFEFKKPGL